MFDVVNVSTRQIALDKFTGFGIIIRRLPDVNADSTLHKNIFQPIDEGSLTTTIYTRHNNNSFMTIHRFKPKKKTKKYSLIYKNGIFSKFFILIFLSKQSNTENNVKQNQLHNMRGAIHRERNESPSRFKEMPRGRQEIRQGRGHYCLRKTAHHRGRR